MTTADQPDESATPAQAESDEQMRERFREAMALKHGAAGAAKGGHGDSGSYGHSVGRGQQRMFRRKSGG